MDWGFQDLLPVLLRPSLLNDRSVSTPDAVSVHRSPDGIMML